MKVKFSVVNLYLIFSPTVLFFLLFKYIPDVVPQHGNLVGNIDAWGSKYVSLGSVLFLSFSIAGIIYRFNKKSKNIVFYNISIVVLYLLTIFFLFSTYQEKGITKNMLDIGWNSQKVFVYLIAVLFLIFGILGNKIPKNNILGIRTKWTLDSETIWNKTHERSRIFSLLTSGVNFYILFNPSIYYTQKMILSSISIIFLCIISIYISYYYSEKFKVST